MSMGRLLIHVEGQTEEDFVNEVLSGHLLGFGYETVNARIIGNARLRSQRGGIRPWPIVRRDILNHLRQDPGSVSTTMVDFYGLPRKGDAAWPGREEAQGKLGAAKAIHVENALSADLALAMGTDFNSNRFIPYVVLHEFEALLFSDCVTFSDSIGRPELVTKLQNIRDQFESPEDINDSPETCPSRRVAALVSGYQKPLFGILAALGIGLLRIRQECPHFHGWLERLEVAPK